MAMRKDTVAKINKFVELFGERTDLNHYMKFTCLGCPCWETLKRYKVIEKVDTIVWYHGEGEEEEVNIYKVNKQF